MEHSSSRHAGGWVWLWAVLIGVAALLPRCLGLADFFTVDEGYHWIGRVYDFSGALLRHDWQATFLTGHPGVTTTWLGSLGRAIALAQGIGDEKSPAGGTAMYLAALRLPLAVVNALVIIPGYLLLRRLLSPASALLAAFLWALSPFLIAFQRLLHVDGLTSSFATLSVLSMLVAIVPGVQRTRRGFWLALLGSGVCAGLAVLSKSSGLVLLPWAGIALACCLFPARSSIWGWIQRVVLHYLAWLGSAALTFYALWPAMWQTPIKTFGAVIQEMLSNGGEPHASGNYFLGQAVADPGPLFYPAVIMWRSTPWTLIGVIGVLVAAVVVGLRLRRGEQLGPNLARTSWVFVGLLGFVLLIAIALTFAAKKFDRYLMPAWPAIEILAACGLIAIWQWLVRVVAFLREQPQLRQRFGWLIGGAITLGGVAIGAFYHPFYISFYNPMLGGGPVAERVLLIGWGEGMPQLADWIKSRPDMGKGTVLTWIPPTLAPFLPRDQIVYEIRNRTIEDKVHPPNYVVVYARGALRHESPDPEAYVRQTPPLYTFSMYGLEYAKIYQLSRQFDVARSASYEDNALGLRGYSMNRVGSTLTITTSWDVQRDMPGGAFLFYHVLDSNGQRVGQIDAPIDDGFFASWQAGQKFGSPLPIGLPADLAPGQYRVVMGVYRPEQQVRLKLDNDALPDAVDGPNALLLATFDVPAP